MGSKRLVLAKMFGGGVSVTSSERSDAVASCVPANPRAGGDFSPSSFEGGGVDTDMWSIGLFGGPVRVEVRSKVSLTPCSIPS